MLEISYIYLVILGCLFAYKTLANDPEREKIWGNGNKDILLTQKEKEIELLKTQLDHYKNYRPAFEQEPSREESMV